MYLQELTRYKENLINVICTETSLLGLLNVTNTQYENDDDIIYKQVFPYGYVPSIEEDKNAYICFDVEVPRVNDNLWKDVALHIFVFAHKDCMKTDRGTRIDLLAERLDTLLNGNQSFGFGLELVSVKRFMPSENYYGVELYYEALSSNQGFTRN